MISSLRSIRFLAALIAVLLIPALASAQAKPAAKAPAAAAALVQTGPGGWIKEFGTMWTFDAPPMDYWKGRYGFEPTKEWLEHVRLSAVRIPGCSASFVSDNGLVMTNHHCARGCITAVSPKDTSYQEAGFTSAKLEDEKKCPGMYADQLVGTEDVTAKVRAAVTSKKTAEQVEQRDKAINDIQAACSVGGLTCQVVTFYQGGKYSLYRYKRYIDVRLVMAPEEGTSFFGGDPDNFTYPRYDLDLTLLRVYENNAPFKAPHYLKWNAKGAGEGELTFVVGNPGSTGRLLTMAQMEFLRDYQYPFQLANYKAQIAFFKALVAQSEANKRMYENTVFGLENSQKAVTGYNAGLIDKNIMAKKAAFEKDFRARILGKPDLAGKYGKSWDNIAAAQKELGSFFVAQQFQGFAGSTLLNLAAGIVRIPEQEKLADSLRLQAYRGPGLARAKGQIGASMPVDVAMDKQLLAMQFERALKALGPNDPFVKLALNGKAPAEAAAALLDNTTLTKVEARKALLDGGAAAVAASTDPLIVFARQVNPMATRHSMRAMKLNTTISANVELVGQAIYAAYGESLPPDATFTLRITDGVVAGFPYNGTIAPYKTSIYGLYGRSAEFDNKPPFQLAPRWVNARTAVDMTTPINFTSTHDIIGGNSGSPVINARAEVVGLVFDGNIESLPNRFIFTDDVARTVAVHTAGITEALKKVYGLPRITQELEAAAAKK
ncbi:MAG TPA: S46 family peptidase [Gemmatimonadaceae bacterium]|jgi:hypothetical protein